MDNITTEMLEAAKIVRDAADKAYEDLKRQYSKQQAIDHAKRSRAELPQTCNHGKLVKIDNIGPHSSGYYYHVVEDGKGGWKNANDGTNYCDDWPNKGGITKYPTQSVLDPAGKSGHTLIRSYDEELNSLGTVMLKHFISGLSQPKVSQMRLAFTGRMDLDPAWAKSRPTLYEVLMDTTQNAFSKVPPLSA